MSSTFYFVTFILAAIGIYHLIGEAMWQIEKKIHADDIAIIKEYIEEKEKQKQKIK